MIIEFMLVMLMHGHPKVPVIVTGFESKVACEREGAKLVQELVAMDQFASGKFRCLKIEKK